MPGALTPQLADQRYHARHSRRQASEHHADLHNAVLISQTRRLDRAKGEVLGAVLSN